MKLTCLHCGKQFNYKLATLPDVVDCECTKHHNVPNLRETGIHPSYKAAEKLLYRAFLAAGIVNNNGQIALWCAIGAFVFPPLALISMYMAITVLTTDIAEPLRKYSGRKEAKIAIILALIGASISSYGCYLLVQNQMASRRVFWQQSAERDLQAFMRSERSFYMNNGRYGNFAEIAYTQPSGIYTLCLGPDLIKEPTSDTLAPVKFCPDMAFLDGESFKIVAITNLDDDPDYDIWTFTDKKELVHLQNDLQNN